MPDPESDVPKDPLFTLTLLMTGSWDKTFRTDDSDLTGELLFNGGTLFNRGEIILGIPRLHLNFRLQGIDRRKLPIHDSNIFDHNFMSPGVGIYFAGKGPFANFLGNSRLLYGVLDEYGLPSRIKNVWAKSPPFSEYRKPIMSDLRLSYSSNPPETYLYLGFPQLGAFSGFAFAQINNGDFSPAFGTGLEWRPSRTFNLRLEGFYTQQVLEPRTPSAWFSVSPPLPEREFRLFGFAAAFDTVKWGMAADFALSETFAFGRGFYGNAALRFGSKPWKFSFAADAVVSRYVGRDGNITNPGLRLAGRLERSWIRSGLFRFDAVFRSPGIEETFERGNISLFFRPSAPRGRAVPLFRFTRASFSLNRNAVNPLKTEDSLDAALGFNIRSLRMVLSGKLNSRSALDDTNIFSLPIFEGFESSKISLEAAFGIKNVSFRISSGYMFRAEKDNIWDFSLYGSLTMKNYGRISLKIAATEFPHKWNYYISWRLGRFTF